MYRPENVGHLGLAYEAYTHFTSPIRRYPDLLVHRAIKAVLQKTRYQPGHGAVELLQDTRRRKGKRKPDASFEQVVRSAEGQKASAKGAPKTIWEDIGVHCSQTERRADEASRDVESWLKCYYMQDRVGEQYTGNITAVVPFGIFETLDDLFVEGLVHISDLGADYFRFDEARHDLVGERTGQRFRLSDRVSVQLVRVDLESRKIDFRLIEGPARATERTGKTAKDAKRGQIGDTPAPVVADEPVGWRDMPAQKPRRKAGASASTPRKAAPARARKSDRPAAKSAKKPAKKGARRG